MKENTGRKRKNKREEEENDDMGRVENTSLSALRSFRRCFSNLVPDKSFQLVFVCIYSCKWGDTSYSSTRAILVVNHGQAKKCWTFLTYSKRQLSNMRIETVNEHRMQIFIKEKKQSLRIIPNA